MTSSFAAILAALLLAACAPAEQRVCNHRCDCEGCSDREYDECLDDQDDDFFEAEREGCVPEHRDLLACENATWYCDGDDYETECGAERRRLRECLD